MRGDGYYGIGKSKNEKNEKNDDKILFVFISVIKQLVFRRMLP